MKLTVIADLHYFGGDITTARFDPEKKQVRYALPMLEHLMRTCDADLCVNLGDLIQDDYDKQRDLEVFARIYGMLSGFPCPCHSILGNHELKMMDCIEDMEALLGHKATYSMDVKGYHLVFLSPQVRPELGIRRGGCYKSQYLGEKTIQWLADDLAKNELPALIFVHYPLAEDEMVDDPLMFMNDRARVKEILKNDPNLLAVFSGHQHVAKEIVEDGVRYILAGALCPAPDESGAVRGEYMEVTLCGTDLTAANKAIPVSEVLPFV